MVTNNKVLTVSYGTFSCTLEGFDDSFETMKVIAEYFRDLAADDRFFGAEPPTPDAEMMARIAERDSERRVHVSTKQGAIVLRATDQADETAPAPSENVAPSVDVVEDVAALTVGDTAERASDHAPISEDIATPVMPLITPLPDTEASEPEETAQAEPEAEATESEATEPEVTEPESSETEDGVQDEIAAEAREDSVSDTPEEFSEETAEEPIVIAADAADVDDVVMTEAPAEEAPVAPETPETSGPDADEHSGADQTQFDDDDVLSGEIIEDVFEDEAPAIKPVQNPAPVSPEDDTIEAKLRRIREVVSRADTKPSTELFSEDEHADTVVADAAADIETALAEDDMAEDVNNTEELTAEDEAPAPLRARVVRMKRADFEEAISSGLLEAEEETPDAAPEGEDSSLSPEAEAELMAELAEVEAELRDDDVDEVDEGDVAGAPEDTDDIEDTAEEPAEEVYDEYEDQDTSAEEDDAATETPSTPARGRVLTESESGSDEDVSRILAQTNSAMEEPGSSRRRQAIAHLRAAVAATRAEKEAGLADEDTDHAEAYRDDLATVVGPTAVNAPTEESEPQPAPDSAADTRAPLRLTKPKSSSGKSTDTATDKGVKKSAPAPLKLVASQRVDESSTGSTETPDSQRSPVRPRRVSTADRKEVATTRDRPAAPVSTSTGDYANFDEYAETVGATRLPEVLEAAAAYLVFVEGRENFSRPMLMRMAQGLDKNGFNREDGLRGFGQLLRDEKISKVRNGRFSVSEQISYKPEDREAG